MKIITWLSFVLLICVGCATSKTIPSQWKSEEFKEQQFNRMLVFANTPDRILQDEIEDKMAIILVSEGMTPVKMHDLFPDIEYKENRSQEEIAAFVLKCKKEGVDKVLLASQKEMIVDTVIAKSLHNYMNSLEPLGLNSKNKDELEYDEKEIITYIIEAAIYDIAVTSEDKPIATTTLKATNPKSLEKIKTKFLKSIKKLFQSR